MMPADADVSGEGPRLRQQRDVAVVCAILATALAGACLWNNLGREYPGLRNTQAAVRAHRDLIAEHRKILEAVTSAVAVNRQELERINRSKRAWP